MFFLTSSTETEERRTEDGVVGPVSGLGCPLPGVATVPLPPTVGETEFTLYIGMYVPGRSHARGHLLPDFAKLYILYLDRYMYMYDVLTNGATGK